MSRLKDKYQKDVVPALQKEFGYKNVMAVPKIHKVVVNMGLGEATSNAKIIDTGADEVARITGQKPRRNRSPRSRSGKGCRSARWSRCAASGCGSSSIGS
jgi:large subunit ribosomal protein L5